MAKIVTCKEPEEHREGPRERGRMWLCPGKRQFKQAMWDSLLWPVLLTVTDKGGSRGRCVKG